LEYGILSAGQHVNCEREFACRSGARCLWAMLSTRCSPHCGPGRCCLPAAGPTVALGDVVCPLQAPLWPWAMLSARFRPNCGPGRCCLPAAGPTVALGDVVCPMQAPLWSWAMLCARCRPHCGPGRCCVPAAGPTVALSVVPMVHKMSVVIRGDVFSNAGLARKIGAVASDVYFRSAHSCQPVNAQC
jgi:hypothetical protein